MRNKKDEDLEEHSSVKSYNVSTNDSTGEDDDDLSENKFEGEVLTQKTPEDKSEEEDTSGNKHSNKSPAKKLDVVEVNTSNSNKNKSNSVKSTFSIEELTVDDEIYTLQCPENFKKQDLCKKIIDFTDFKTTITSNNEVYQMKLLNSDKEFITLAMPDRELHCSLLMLPLEGHIVIHKDVNAPACEPMDENLKKCSVSFPNDIKLRHPLLGVDWKEHVNLANAAFKKKRKKTKREKLRDLDEIKTEKIKLENEEIEILSPKKKKRKRTA